MAMTDAALRAAKLSDKQYKMHDSAGLFVIVRPSGQKLWRFKYRLGLSEQQMSLGTYPLVSLKDARLKRDDLRRKLLDGVDPAGERRKAELAARMAAGNTFGAVARELLDKLEMEGCSKATQIRNERFFKQLEPDLGRRAVIDIEPVEILSVLKKFERRGIYETAKRLRSFIARVYRYAIVTGRARQNPASDLGEALIKPKKKHLAAITDPAELGELLRSMETFDKYMTTTLALKLTPHLFVRPGELRHMEWTEIDWDAKVWRIPPDKMKMRNEHVVPLSRQALEILNDAKVLRLGSKYVFPSIRTGARPMSENTINAALRRLGYNGDQMTAHGFRSTASTLLNEAGIWSPDAIERALAHKGHDRVRAIYHRGAHWKERVEMAQWWSDYLDQLKGCDYAR